MSRANKVCFKVALLCRSRPRCSVNRRAFSVSSGCQADAVGFVGLGNMGSHMAQNLLKKGYPVIAYDLSAEAVKTLVDAGGQSASSPAEVASQAKQLVTMLPSSPHVIEVYTGSNGIFTTVQSGSLLIDSSTIDPAVSKDMAAIAETHSASFVDAPVSGGVQAAKDAILTFMVGGKEAPFEQAKVLLSNMGKNVIHCGDVGTGETAKICNNMMLAISMIGLSEVTNLGIKLGMDPKLLAKVMNMSSGRCWSSEVYHPYPGIVETAPSNRNYEGGFGSALMVKDLGLAQNAATATRAPTPLGSAAHQLYRLMTNLGYDKKDFSSAFLFLQEQEKK
ncbi:3-hydroxyisobutyrate dehydrogenase, mitochondrial [Lamellibrachia satsuma]|nr:3-hydroxyisobutyrate dehydrogenase, mitochondrial [Lamellibrachia satsuma]